jgi:DNA invertase Pin-like site-specific DNA recombinase
MTIHVVDIYCRTATNDSETRTKLEQQEAACRTYCQAHGLLTSPLA